MVGKVNHKIRDAVSGEAVHRGMVALGIPAVFALLAWGGVQLYEINANQAGEARAMAAMEKRMDMADLRNGQVSERLLRRIERLDGQVIDIERRGAGGRAP